jgi:hypothetical protein
MIDSSSNALYYVSAMRDKQVWAIATFGSCRVPAERCP